jgi:hypothetical protein
MRVKLFLVAAACLASVAAQARECLGVSFPEQATFSGRTLALNGLGLRQATIFKVNVYVAALYVAKTSGDAASILAANAPFVARLHFVRSVGAADIAKGWTEGFERNPQAGVAASDPRVAQLRAWMADFKAGQEMSFTFDPAAGVEVEVNGAKQGSIHGDDFARALLSVWLGVPPNAAIKAGLLGGPCS